MKAQNKKFKFFLGGADAEMVRIREVISASKIPFEDKGLKWDGAKASAYASEIVQAVNDGFTPVLVELKIDCAVPEGTVDINHHDDRSGEPASILQVLSLLEQQPTRWDTLIAANDAGWFPGLQSVAASRDEMTRVREADRRAQGITAEQEAEAELALARIHTLVGKTRVLRMSHSKTAPIGDAIAIDAISKGHSIPPYIIISEDGESNYSGSGKIARALKEKFDGWTGGTGLATEDGPAYWGGYPSHGELMSFLLRVS